MKQKLSILYRGMSGKLGNKVYSVLKNGYTYAKRAPGSYNVIATPSQAIIRERFREAHLFAKTIISDPLLKSVYTAKAKPGSNAYFTAVSEYLLNCREENMRVYSNTMCCSPCVVESLMFY